MRRLGTQGVDLRNSFTLAVQGVASGEIPLGMNLYGTHTRVQEKRRPGGLGADGIRPYYSRAPGRQRAGASSQCGPPVP